MTLATDFMNFLRRSVLLICVGLACACSKNDSIIDEPQPEPEEIPEQITLNKITYKIDFFHKTAMVYLGDKDIVDAEIVENISVGGYDCVVTSIGGFAFSKCPDLQQVTVPATVERIGTRAFDGCDKLAKVNITDLVAWCRIPFEKDSDNPLATARNLYLHSQPVTDLVIPDGVERIGQFAFYSANITSVDIPAGVKQVGAHAFADCRNLEDATIAGGSEEIGNDAFRDCRALKNVTFDGSIGAIGQDAFVNCYALQNFSVNDIGQFCDIKFVSASSNPIYYTNTIKVNGTEIADLIVPESVKEISQYAFPSCRSLKSVKLSDSVKKIGTQAFAHCDNLESVEFGAGLKTVDSNAFYSCQKLTFVNLGPTVYSLGENAFDDCRKLKTLIWSAALETVKSRAFFNCDALEEVNITDLGAWCRLDFENWDANPLANLKSTLKLNGETITHLEVPRPVTAVKPYVFMHASSLQSVTFLANVRSVGKDAFDSCDNITTVNCYTKTVPENNGAFKNPRRITLHVPAELEAQFRSAPGWSDFGTIIADLTLD